MKPQPRYKPGDKIGGRYHVYQALTGGMGEVYLAQNLETNYPYALKTFKQKYLSDKLKEFFLAEAEVWITLGIHPNIVRCFHMENLDEHPFLILEWIAGDDKRGTSLHQWLVSGKIESKKALDFIIDICRGLIYADSMLPGIVHRDLKPSNVLLNQNHTCKITDFGLATIAKKADVGTGFDEDNTEQWDGFSIIGNEVGTPPYMAPEQWRGEQLDQRTDIYAIGCILYELLTNQWVFPIKAKKLRYDEYRSFLRSCHLNDKPPSLKGNIPPEIDKIIKKCLEKDKIQRYQSISELLDEISQVHLAIYDVPPKPQEIIGQLSAGDYSNRAITYRMLGRYQLALRDDNKAIELKPDEPFFYNDRGTTYQILGEFQEALADFNTVIDLGGTHKNYFYNRGVIYHSLREYEKALKDFNQAIELDPYDPGFYSDRGNAYSGLENYEEAINDYSHAIKLKPDLARAYHNRGLAYKSLNYLEDALLDFNKAIEADPYAADTYFHRAEIYRTWEQIEKAVEDYSKAISIKNELKRALIMRKIVSSDLDRIDPSIIYEHRGAVFEKQGKSNAALDDFLQAFELDPGKVSIHYNIAAVLMSEEKIEEALPHLEQAVEGGFAQAIPVLTEIRLRRGLTFFGAQQYDMAIEECSKAIELAPDSAMAYLQRGLSFGSLGKRELAIADYNHVINLDPNMSEAYYGRGISYSRIGKHDLAIADYNSALQLSPNDAKTYTNRGSEFFAIGNYGKAIQDFTQAINLDPTDEKAYFGRARCYGFVGKHEEGIIDCDKAIEQKPDYSPAYGMRANRYASLGKHNEAIRDFSRAIELDPNNAEYFYNRGNSYKALEKYELAINNYNDAIFINPRFEMAYLNRGNIYMLLENYELAISDFDKTIYLNPELWIVYQNKVVALVINNQIDLASDIAEQALDKGYPQAAILLAQISKESGKTIGMEKVLGKLGFIALSQVTEPDELKTLVHNFSFMLQADFIIGIEQVILHQIPVDKRSGYEQRITWLRQIATEQNQQE